MNLTPEELLFFRAQRLASATEVIAFNYGLYQQLIASIPPQQQPGPTFPFALATMTHGESDASRDLLIQFFNGKPCYAQMLPILATWKLDQFAVQQSPAALTNEEQAERLFLAFNAEFPTILSFNSRVPVGDPNRDLLLSQYNSSQLQTFTKYSLEVDTTAKLIPYIETFK